MHLLSIVRLILCLQCNDYKIRCDSWRTQEPESNEFISALAAGMKSKFLVEVSPGVSPSTLALAAAARHTGGRLVCILPERVLAESNKVIKDSGLKDIVELKTGTPKNCYRTKGISISLW